MIYIGKHYNFSFWHFEGVDAQADAVTISAYQVRTEWGYLDFFFDEVVVAFG